MKNSIQGTVYCVIAGVCYSRIYLARHTFDQILAGILMGDLVARFLHSYWRIHVFDY